MKIKAIRSLLTLAISATIILIPALAYANVATDPACTTGGSAAANSSLCQQSGSNPLIGPDGIITKAIKIISYFAGAAAVIMIIISGIQFVISHGDSSGVATARKTLIYAIVGIAVVIFAQAIVIFVLNNLK